MKSGSVKEIKAELQTLDAEKLVELSLRLIKFKKENKELLSYLLFEAHDEPAYISNVKEALETQFADVPKSNLYYAKKNLRKILRYANKCIKYSGIKQTEIDIRIFYCSQMNDLHLPMHPGTVLFNLYQQQIKKINSLLSKLPEDLQYDYEYELSKLS